MSVLWFNNSDSTHPSPGLELQLPLSPKPATPVYVLKSLFVPSDPIYADVQGSTQILSSGNILLGYGLVLVTKEHGPLSLNGSDIRFTTRFTTRFGADRLVQSYRAFQPELHATPMKSPSLVVENNGECGAGYVSWNGATEVTAWAVNEGPNEGKLRCVRKIGYTGFETIFGHTEKCVQVVAMIGMQMGARSNVACA